MTSDGNLWAATCSETVPPAPPQSGETVDLAVIGGGFTGCSAALRAAELGASVCLIEAREIGHGGSGRNVGLVNAGLWMPPDAIVARLGAGGEALVDTLGRAPDLVFELIARHGIACAPVRNGTLHCAHAPAGMADLRRRHDQQRARGAPVQLLGAEEAQRRTGTRAVHGALFDARAGTIQPLGYCRGLARAAASLGARIVTGCAVRGIVRDGDLWRLDRGGATLRARHLLLATNAYHDAIAGIAAPDFAVVHFFLVATAPLPAPLRDRILLGGEGCWDTARVMSAFRLDPAGRLVLGGIGNPDGPFGALHRGWSRRKLRRLFPALAALPVEHAWCGRIAMTADHLPKITEPAPGALCIHGYSGRGIAPGTVFGRAAAEALLTGDRDILPLVPVFAHAERRTAARARLVETGAALTHLVDQRP